MTDLTNSNIVDVCDEDFVVKSDVITYEVERIVFVINKDRGIVVVIAAYLPATYRFVQYRNLFIDVSYEVDISLCFSSVHFVSSI